MERSTCMFHCRSCKEIGQLCNSYHRQSKMCCETTIVNCSTNASGWPIAPRWPTRAEAEIIRLQINVSPSPQASLDSLPRRGEAMISLGPLPLWERVPRQRRERGIAPCLRRNDGNGTLNIKRLDILKRRPQRLRPFSRQHLEIGVILPDALGVLHFQRVGFVGEHVDRQPHAQV